MLTPRSLSSGALLALSALTDLPAQSAPPRREALGQQLHGALSDPRATEFAARTVEFVSTSGRRARAEVDADGRFVSPPLTPGSYRLRLALSELRQTAPASPVAWLGSTTLHVGTVDVSRHAGLPVQVPTPPLATLALQVGAAGQPLAEVDVFVFRLCRENDAPVTRSGPRGLMEQSPDDTDAVRRSLCVRTDANGRARLAVAAPGRWQLYARHARGAAASGPHEAEILPEHLTAGAERGVTLELPTSALRGQVNSTPGHVEVQLYRRAVADDSPFSCHDIGFPQQNKVPSAALERSGRFEFAWLPADAWVVRVVDRRHEVILAQSLVETDGKAALDLGDLTAPPRFTVELACGRSGLLPDNRDTAIQVQWLPDAAGPPVFVTNTWPNGHMLQVRHLCPGRYRARRITDATEAGSWGVIGEPFGPAVEFVIDELGRPTPSSIF